MFEFDGVGLFDSEFSADGKRSALYAMLQNAVPACSPFDIDPAFADVLYSVWCEYSFTVSSGFRSVEYEKSRGRSGKSSHSHTENEQPAALAVDIVCTSNVSRYKLISAFMRAGVTRFGVARGFLHVDMDVSKPQGRIWTYDDKNHERKG